VSSQAGTRKKNAVLLPARQETGPPERYCGNCCENVIYCSACAFFFPPHPHPPHPHGFFLGEMARNVLRTTYNTATARIRIAITVCVTVCAPYFTNKLPSWNTANDAM
jgi:hypothetical protein